MAETINIGIKQNGDDLTAGEVNQIVAKTNAAIVEQNQTKTELINAIALKVPTVQGKGLSTEDYTSLEKQKLSRLNEFNKGFFANEAAIIVAYPEGSAGWFVINGETDTVWLWDVEGAAWKNSGSSVNIGGGGITDVLYADLAVQIASSLLIPGQQYKITDRGDRGIIVTAISTNKLAPEAVRFMLCPSKYLVGTEDDYNNYWLGVWNANITASVGNLAIWNGLVWKCIAEVTDPLDSPDENAVNWQLVPKESFSNNEYIELIFDCAYDFDSDIIYRQWDKFGNVVGTLDYNDINPCDATDWNMSTNSPFANNHCPEGIYNNSNDGGIFGNRVISIIGNSNDGEIGNNSNAGYIYYNSNSGTIEGNCNAGDIEGNSNDGHINFNYNGAGIYNNSNGSSISNNYNISSIEDNSNNGGIFNNKNTGLIRDNSNNGDITYNSNLGHIENNSNLGKIGYNDNKGNIENNSNGAVGYPNSGNIAFNSNSGTIFSNINSGRIDYNSKIGNISNLQPDDNDYVYHLAQSES